MKRILTRIAQGLGIGIAPLIPGVSAATIALIMGVYEKLITELAALVRIPKRFSELRENASRDYAFLIPIGIGIAFAIGVGAIFLPGLIAEHPLPVFSLFSGLIATSAVVLARTLHGPRRAHLWLALGVTIGILAALLPTGLTSEPSVLGTLLAGAGAVSAMLLPGVSGSYVLLLIGYYTNVLNALHTFDVGFLVIFAIGALFGAAVSITLIRRLLARFHLQTMLVLIGIIAGALGKPLSIAFAAVRSGSDWFVLTVFLLIGVALTVFITGRGANS